MAIRKQMIWDPKKDRYAGFVDYGEGGPILADPDTLASEAHVFLLVGARSHWKCPIGNFLTDKISSTHQTQLIKMALEMAAEAGLKVWSVTADGTAVNLSTFQQLGCKFGSSYDTIISKFKHPTAAEDVFVIADPCHMLKLSRNALAHLGTIIDNEGEKIQWEHFQQLHILQEQKGLKMGNKITANHIKFEKHKMNVRLAAQTLSSSVADAIEFLDICMKNPKFKESSGTVKFTRTIDRLFDMLNSRSPIAKGYKQPLRASNKNAYEEFFKTTANYLLQLKTDSDTPQQLATHRRKTFIIGFVVTIKSTMEMTDQMFSKSGNPFKYLLTYKFSQDHIELLFSCIRSKGGWNNNPNCLQLKYALRQLLMKNAVTASKNANCDDFQDKKSTTVIPILHQRKHRSPLKELSNQDEKAESEEEKAEENFMFEQLCQDSHCDFISNVLFYIGGFIASKLVKKLTCESCQKCLVGEITSIIQAADHDYCRSSLYSEVSSASAFTLFVNNGGLRIPSKSVFTTIELCEHIFRQYVCHKGNSINSTERLKNKMILEACHHLLLDGNKSVFADHELGANEDMVEDDHQVKLIKWTADKYYTLRLFTYGKHYTQSVIQNGMPSDRHHLNKLTLFKNQ